MDAVMGIREMGEMGEAKQNFLPNLLLQMTTLQFPILTIQSSHH